MSGSQGSGRKRRRLRVLLVAALVFVVVLAGTVFAAAWYFSDQLLDVSHGPPSYNLVVQSLTSRTVTLPRTSGISDGGRFGLEWAGGRAIVGSVVRRSGADLTRQLLQPGRGLRVGRRVRYDVAVFRTPKDVGLRFRVVTVPDRLGPMPAWLVPGRSSTWVIAVHGLGSTRDEPIRAMPVLASLGLPILAIDYRNDAGAPASPDHLYHLGASEWMDLQAAARYAFAHGATHLVLYGYSMGGNIVESFMEHSALGGRVRAIVLDAPALDWYQILELAAEERNLPGAFTAVVERLVAWRIDLSSLDSVDHNIAAIPVKRPTLLFQGTSDKLVPPASNREFASKYREFVTYRQFPGANHVQSWNVDPTRYDRILMIFLRNHLSCSQSGRMMICA